MNTVKISNQLHSVAQQVGNKDNNQGAGFADVIKDAIGRVDDMHAKAEQSVVELMQGKTGIHETMLALQKADISFRMLLQVRNKAMDAYREIMHMQF